MPYLKTGDLAIFYEKIGVGEPVIFLHSHYSRGIIAFSCQLLDFQQNYSCFLPDYRGHGRTKYTNLEWSTPQLADDIADFMDGMNIARAHLIGYSCGANVALYCAVNNPQAIATITTIGTNGFAYPSGADEYEPERLIENKRQDIIARMIANHEEAHKGNWQEFARQSAKDWRLYPQLTKEQLNSISCPALFIAGENDEFATGQQLKFLCSLVHNSRYLIVRGCSHRPHMSRENPKFVNDAILQFLQANSIT